MANPFEQPDDALPPALEDDLKRLFDGAVAPEVDRAVMDRALPILTRRRWARRMQWTAPCAAAAAIGLMVWLGWSPARMPRLARDIDGNGRVDILDALVLARRVDAGDTSGEWDVNGDGVVDTRDADCVARSVVTLPAETES